MEDRKKDQLDETSEFSETFHLNRSEAKCSWIEKD